MSIFSRNRSSQDLRGFEKHKTARKALERITKVESSKNSIPVINKELGNTATRSLVHSGVRIVDGNTPLTENTDNVIPLVDALKRHTNKSLSAGEPVPPVNPSLDQNSGGQAG